mgnify:FL=1
MAAYWRCSKPNAPFLASQKIGKAWAHVDSIDDKISARGLRQQLSKIELAIDNKIDETLNACGWKR